MRVVCINADAWPSPDVEGDDDDFLKNGVVYEVEDVFFDDGYIFYQVVGSSAGYWENCFARTSDISETTFERNYIKETFSTPYDK